MKTYVRDLVERADGCFDALLDDGSTDKYPVCSVQEDDPRPAVVVNSIYTDLIVAAKSPLYFGSANEIREANSLRRLRGFLVVSASAGLRVELLGGSRAVSCVLPADESPFQIQCSG